VLLELCDKRIIKNKSDEIKKALEGNYNPSWLFLLAQNLKMWKIHETQVLCIDKKIDEVLKDLNRDGIKSSIAVKKNQSGIISLKLKTYSKNL